MESEIVLLLYAADRSGRRPQARKFFAGHRVVCTKPGRRLQRLCGWLASLQESESTRRSGRAPHTPSAEQTKKSYSAPPYHPYRHHRSDLNGWGRYYASKLSRRRPPCSPGSALERETGTSPGSRAPHPVQKPLHGKCQWLRVSSWRRRNEMATTFPVLLTGGRARDQ